MGIPQEKRNMILKTMLDNRCRSLKDNEREEIEDFVREEIRDGGAIFDMIMRGDIPLRPND